MSKNRAAGVGAAERGIRPAHRFVIERVAGKFFVGGNFEQGENILASVEW
jgi:hypothetical protein